MENRNRIKASNEYLNSEFYIKVYKEKGKWNTIQIYYGTQAEIGVCISSIIEQLIRNNIFTGEEIEFAVKLAIDKINREDNKCQF